MQNMYNQLDPNEGNETATGQDGLAAQLAQEGTQVEEVIELLMKGVPPEQLLKQGIPMEVIKQAINLIMRHQQAAQAEQPPMGTPGEGLKRMETVGR